MTLKPLYPNIAIEIPTKHEEKIGNIIVPVNQNKDEADQGIVYAVYNYKCPVAIGDKVTFKKFAGQVLKFDGKDIIIMPEDDITAIL